MFFLEFKRCLKRKSVYIALLVGIGIVVLSYFDKQGRGELINNQIVFKNYINIMCEDANRQFILKARGGFYDLFIIFLPLLASIPYSDSYRDDISCGLLRNIYSRVDKKNYLVSKFIANYIISFIVIVIPFVIDAIILKIVLPTYKYDALFYDIGYIVSNGWMIDLFKYNSDLFIVLSIIFTGLVGSTFSCIALVFNQLINNKYIIILLPFIIYRLIDTISVVIFRSTLYLPLGQDFLANSKYTIIFIVLGSLLTYFIFIKKGVKYQGV